MEPEKIEGLWTHLHWLTVLAEQGSFTAAAARLGVSKAAMSQRIAELERAAGVSLVQRTTRSVRFTEAGQQLVDDTRGQYERIATSFSNVRDQAGVARGLIRVTAPVALGRQQVIPKLSQFVREHPEVRVQLDLSDRLSSIATEGFDLAIRHSTNAPETHVAWKLCDTRSLIVATRAYLRRRGTPTTPADLTAHDCLSYPRAQTANTWSFEPSTGRRSAGGPVTINVSGPVAANNSEALRDAALDDLGIALLPDFTAQAAVGTGKLVVLLPEWRTVGAFAERIYVVRPYASHVPRAVKLFVDYLRGAFADGFPC
ncbi:LysR family transcriptional regulator [Pandoraea apista]|uniref:LysR family transcriptional regulator n=1 Tax=Pandoraea apista TaxID=93218 RepID=A0ABX9ZT93_9BURK|nr:LysR family transcriptional regulator [Pandoraea apista]PTD98865.1 LysR family transcriptional regulator [Pandoraea apista]RRJ34578.1 LysR family transcriptional regulator [Pandoraea apista]RRJ80727.1 LysR family transcriptional regulator [Pandoraea apista]RSD14522.1 LysR family transcriptional regulator [Pandoraea apista]RSD20611.1 LysR family transcriptional regulator [Pandoraea apista]